MTDQAKNVLFSPAKLGDLELANRIVMSPLTRARDGEDGVPTERYSTRPITRSAPRLAWSSPMPPTSRSRAAAMR